MSSTDPFLRQNDTGIRHGHFCPVCQQAVAKFDPVGWDYIDQLNSHEYIFSIFQGETFDPVRYYCPRCRASDRERLYALFLQSALRGLDPQKEYRFIDFAPSASLSPRLRTVAFLDYRSADLLASNVDDRVDIMNLTCYGNDSVDMFLCSHVLEHVADDAKAMSELFRILKPGGWGILMVPIVLTLEETYEDPTLTTDEQRWKHFGQNDHLRLYAKHDFMNRMDATGFTVEAMGQTHFGAEVFRKHGINRRSVLYVVSK